MIKAFTLIELLVVIAILGLLATLLTPAVTSANDTAIFTTDGNNLKQLMTMMVKHRTDTRQTWPYPDVLIEQSKGAGGLTQYNGSDVGDDNVAKQVTHAAFWTISFRSDLSPDLFNSPATEPKITRAAGVDSSKDFKTNKADIIVDINDWLLGGDVDYMLDWSAPRNAGNIRPTLSNRNHEDLFMNKINVVFSDSHLSSESDFEVVSDQEVNHLATAASGITADNILDTTGDEVGDSLPVTQQYFMGRGHRVRAHMK